MTLKTKTVSEELGVNPTTVQRWVKHFEIPCKRNQHGHYIFTQSDLLLLKNIKEQLRQGLSMSEVRVSIPKKEHATETHTPAAVSTGDLTRKFDTIVMRIKNVEQQLEDKADEIVSVQLLQHRNEIDDLLKKITKLEAEVENMKNRLAEKEESALSLQQEKGKAPKKRWLASFI